ncbi:hypothetical protein QJS66_05820 [Kocuria rhizophila]|nr:hypothetical protein QJS66_05820 [Kocuria rhizophila]
MDQASLNGTYVSSDRVNTKVLENGDEVQIGKFRFTFYHSVQNGSTSMLRPDSRRLPVGIGAPPSAAAALPGSDRVEVRFLEDQGLAHPHRTVRIPQVLGQDVGASRRRQLQQERYFPLRLGNAWTAGRTRRRRRTGSVLGCGGRRGAEGPPTPETPCPEPGPVVARVAAQIRNGGPAACASC